MKKRGLSTKGNKKVLFKKMINYKNMNGGKKPSYSVVSYQAQGKRQYMEDRIIIKLNKTNCFFVKQQCRSTHLKPIEARRS